jgi:N-acetylmuramic acid 6-phosphate etherase
VTGSTRMKAGTATKLILNMISTGLMIKVGKTHGNIVKSLKLGRGATKLTFS